MIKLGFIPSKVNLVGYQQVNLIINTDNQKPASINCSLTYSQEFIRVTNVSTPFSTLKAELGTNVLMITGQFPSNIDWSKEYTLLTFYINPQKNGNTSIAINDCYINVNGKDIRLSGNKLIISVDSIVGENPNAVTVSDTPIVTSEYTPQVYIKEPTQAYVSNNKASVADWLTFFLLVFLLIGIGVWFFKWQKSGTKNGK